jgi:hypothetical protein
MAQGASRSIKHGCRSRNLSATGRRYRPGVNVWRCMERIEDRSPLFARQMAVASAKFEAGQVFLPERANWLPDLEAELFAFPGGRHDDQCDSISQALCDGDRNMPLEITDEILAMASQPW